MKISLTSIIFGYRLKQHLEGDVINEVSALPGGTGHMNNRGPEPIFNAMYDTYDNIRFLRGPAERLVVNAKIALGQRVLDVACGTGWATMAVARAVGNTGRVTGIDIADKMLDMAREKATSEGLSNVEYSVGDAEALGFDDTSFDVVICASSIFFLRDIFKALHEWHRVLKVGGTIAFSSFGVNFLQPFNRLFSERLTQYDGQAPQGQQPSEKTDTVGKCRELLKRAGFEKIEITTEQLGYYIEDVTVYWQEMSSTPVKLRLDRLSTTDLEKFKAEHLSEVESLRTEQGIWIDIPVHFSVAI
jgi:ubiquinone/menaquinone biosynthesis C-methylase UbiE